MSNRESAYSALFSLVSSIPGFITTSRIWKVWGDVPPPMQPALYQTQKREVPTNTPGLNPIWTYSVDLWIYAHTQADKNVAPSTILNSLIDAIEAALAPSPVTNKQTLGGLVEHAWIDGSITTDEGYFGDQAVAIIPITIKHA
jgi:hypothetical protein